MKKYILSHDFGTSSDKIVLFSLDGNIIKSHSETYPTYVDFPGCSEQDPEDWWKAFCHGNEIILEGIDPGEIACCAIDGTDPDLICLDENDKVLHRCLMWNDTRGKEEAAAWNEKAEVKELPKLSYNSHIVRILWMMNHNPEVIERSTHIFSTNHSYLIYRLSKESVCDSDSAVDSGMYVKAIKDWDPLILKEIKLDRSLFPRVVGPTEIVGYINKDVSEECHLTEGIPLIGCYPDASAAAVGTGAYLLHHAILSCGTSAGIMYTAEEESFGFKAGAFSVSAGSSYNWVLETLLGKRDHELAEEMLKSSPAGSHGVIFLPYLSGERSPFIDPDAKGTWCGLNKAVTKADLLKSAVEGIMMNLSLFLKEIREKGYPVEEMSITGGFSKSDAICQIIADVMDVKLYTLKDTDLSAAIGSAVLGGVALGIYEDISVVKQFLKTDKVFTPNKENAEYYASRLSLFRKIHEQLTPLYPEL